MPITPEESPLLANKPSYPVSVEARSCSALRGSKKDMKTIACITKGAQKRSVTDARAYEATTLSVDVVELYSCRSDCHFMSFSEGRLWTCRYCHMSSDRLVAQQIKRQDVSSHVSTAVIGRCDEASPQCQNPIESEQEGLKSDGR